MARILLAVAAALCALLVVNATPAFRDVQEAELDMQNQLADLESLYALQDLSGSQYRWMNATEILEKIEQALTTVEDKIAEVSRQVEDTVESIMEGMEQSALEAADKWNATVQEWADKAAQAGVDVQECMEQERTIRDVAADLMVDARACIDTPVVELRAALSNVKAVGPQALALLEEAAVKIVECNEKSNVWETSVCLAGSLPVVHIKAIGLVARATWLSGLVAARAAAIGPLATLCTSKATAGRAAEATAIVDDTVSCIKGKLGF